ncbi:uncharacterized protein PV09_01474 [Verruconis gallopava]|uniref:Uncharacterized protein n=1 Tax=Verruconis gallopava TaxID=253628 RepID=A0A0D2B8I3_9PEZI|nr:uncharacterized protein PV09_01474 [Verruconis gallopava]KIW07509.1 hypothetical protein PV09_01474 [Verruconis gallopava]
MARSYFITRVSSSNEDPTALEFFPPKGSDELHEALKEAFPYEPNLAARMRAAVIEFLLQEQQVEQFAPISPDYLPSPQSSFVSTLPSPAMPSSRTSQETTISRRQSSAAGQPTQEALMDVWCLPNKPQAKIHTRRTMTPEEKKAYKQKRLVGACADCKRRRRKCEHNSSASSTGPVPQKVGKHKKRASNQTPSSKPAVSDPFSDMSMLNFELDMPSMAMSDMTSFSAPFELETTDFDFTPELNVDWQLFPDLPATNTYASMSPIWSIDHDNSAYSTRAGLSQQRVSPSRECNNNIFGQEMLDHVESNSGLIDSGFYGSSSAGNAPISPVTPESLSPVSHKQSSIGLYDGATQSTLNRTISHFSTGANLEQSRVSPRSPRQATLIHEGSLDTLILPDATEGPRMVPIPAPNINKPRYRAPSSPATARLTAHFPPCPGDSSRTVADHAMDIQSAYETRSEHESHRNDQHTPQSHRNGRDWNIREIFFATRVLLQAINTQQPQASSIMSSPEHSSTAAASQPKDGKANAHEQTVGTGDRRSRQSRNDTLRVRQTSWQNCTHRCETSQNSHFLALTPICVALYGTYCITTQSDATPAFVASFAIGLMLVLVLLPRKDLPSKDVLPVRLVSHAYRFASHVTGESEFRSKNMPSRQSPVESGSHSSNASASPRRALTSHFGLLGASAMV